MTRFPFGPNMTPLARYAFAGFAAFVCSFCNCCGFHNFGAKCIADEPAKITYEDHIKPIFREHCTSCHNANDKKSGLALDTYQAALAGGSGGECLAAGDVESSRLYGLTARKEQPFMPPNQDMIPQAKVDLLKTWIEQGMPENSGSAIQKPKANSAALGIVSSGRPEGAPPMPDSMIKQTPFHTPRAATVSALAASPWSPLVAVGGQMQVSLYHSETGELQGVIPFPEGEPQSITFSRDGRLILIGGGRHSVSGYAALHEIATGFRIARVGDELDIVLAADISDDNQLIALAGPQKMVRVFETLTGALKAEQKKHTDWIHCVRFSPDGLLLATADRSGGLVVWETQTGRLYMELQGHKGEIRSIAWRPDSLALVSGSFDGTLKMWDMNEGKQIKSWDAHGGGVGAVAICNDGTMVSTGRDNKVKVWDAAGNAAGEMPPLVEAGHEVAITVDAKQIVAGDWIGNVRMWQRANPADERKLLANPTPLEQSLSAAQQQLSVAATSAQAAEAEFVAMQSQQSAAQKQLADLMSQIASASEALQTTTATSVQLKGQSDAIVAQLAAKASEFATVQANRAEKNNQWNSAAAAKKSADEAIAALQAKKSMEGSDAASIDAQIALHATQSQAQAASMTKLQQELETVSADSTARENANAELKTAFDAKNSEFAATTTKVQEFLATKGFAESKLESANVALKSASDAVVPSQAKLDAANALMAATKKRVDGLQSDIARFTAIPNELAAKKTANEHSIATAAQQMQSAEAVTLTTKTQFDVANEGMKKLEEQLASLQAMMVAEQAKRTAIQTELVAKQQAVDAIRAQVQQSESELSVTTSQQQLFEQAYGKK